MSFDTIEIKLVSLVVVFVVAHSLIAVFVNPSNLPLQFGQNWDTNRWDIFVLVDDIVFSLVKIGLSYS